MVIAMWCADALKCFSAITAAHEIYIRAIDRVFIFRINKNFGIIPGPLADIVIITLKRPCFSAISTHKKATFGIFNNGVNFICVGRGNSNTCYTPYTFRETFLLGQCRPCYAAICTFPDATALTAAFEAV